MTWQGIASSTLVIGRADRLRQQHHHPLHRLVGAQIDTLFVNTFGLPVNSGITLFALALIVGMGWAAWVAHNGAASC